jgi:DNA polymerase III delta prime subunit
MAAPREHFAWVEKYRPQTIDACILPENVRQTFLGVLTQKDTTNLLLYGLAGVGKTTVAKALCRTLDVETLVVNASETSGIEHLRTRVKDFATSMSLDGKRKYVILDEADNLEAQSSQKYLRAFMEEFSHQCGFILTANYVNRIVPAIQSRCSLVDFRIPTKERPKLIIAFGKRVMDILDKEHVTYSRPVVGGAVQMHFPDFRRILNELQRFSATGELSEAILSQMSDKDATDLIVALKTKEFNPLRKWIGDHEDMESSSFYDMLYNHVAVESKVESGLPTLILLMDHYQYEAAFAANKQLNALACLVELQAEGGFK